MQQLNSTPAWAAPDYDPRTVVRTQDKNFSKVSMVPVESQPIVITLLDKSDTFWMNENKWW